MLPIPSVSDATALDLLRAALILVLAVSQAAMAFWPDLRGWRHTISSRSADLGNPVVPSPPTFAIWGLIYTSCAVLAVWQALPGNLADPFLRQIGWPVAALFALNSVWAAWVPRHGLDWVSVGVILAEVALALGLVFAVGGAGLSGWGWWSVAFPLQLFAGWATAAAFVNLASTLVRAGGGGWTDPRDPRVALAMIQGAVVLALIVTILSGGWPFAVAMAWALIGIAAANRAHRLLALPAVSGAVAVTVAAVVSA